MTAHELAKMLLIGPDVEVRFDDDYGGTVNHAEGWHDHVSLSSEEPYRPVYGCQTLEEYTRQQANRVPYNPWHAYNFRPFVEKPGGIVMVGLDVPRP